MATISTNTYLDGGTARTAGEAWTINSGAIFTIRTDSRWHLNSPASYTGSISSITCNEGEVIFDGTDVRWLAISGGGGIAAIGDTISQGGVSGYFLGFWSSLTAQPSLTIGTTGFIKLREVTGGTYTAGVLTFSGGGAATASGTDITGWMEIVADASATMTFPRLGKHTIRGDWFYLENTNGSIGQTIQIPTNGGGANTFCPGIWVETSSGSTTYEYWASLNTSCGWAKISETKARLILEFPNKRNLLFYTIIDSNGKCSVTIPPLKEMNECEGNVLLEVIAESTHFESWRDKFKLETNKKVQVEMVMQEKDIIVENNKPRVEVIVEEIEDKINKSVLNEFNSYVSKRNINLEKIIKNKDSFFNLLHEYKKHNNVTKENIIVIVEELKKNARTNQIERMLNS